MPAAQLGAAVAALRIGPDGSSNLTIRLDPAELGLVQVQIVRGHDGSASVSVAVQRPDTLARLQADLTHLHLALDRAGIGEQRSLAVHLAPALTETGSSHHGTELGVSGERPVSIQTAGDPSTGGRSAGGHNAGNAGAGGQGSGGQAQQGRGEPGTRGAWGASGADEASPASLAGIRRATGIDITA